MASRNRGNGAGGSVPSPLVAAELQAVLALPAEQAAPRLIGWELQANGVRARIVETEAYQGVDDLACHASRGCTPRSATLWAEPGTLYVYLCYGIHSLLNIVCEREGAPAAVLLRSVEVLAGEQLARRRRGDVKSSLRRLTNGPGKLTQALGITVADNGTMLGAPDCPALLLPPSVQSGQLASGPRVGVDYAGPQWSKMPWRWWEAGFPVAGNGRRNS